MLGEALAASTTVVALLQSRQSTKSLTPPLILLVFGEGEAETGWLHARVQQSAE